MGFWDVAKKVGKTAIQGISTELEKREEIKFKYESYSDDELMKIAESDSTSKYSTAEKSVAKMILKGRGFNFYFND